MDIEYVKQLEQELWRLRNGRSVPESLITDTNSYLNKNKYAGMRVWDETNGLPKWATGADPAAPWVTFDTTPPPTPVAGPEFVIAQNLSNSTFSSVSYTNGPSQEFTLDEISDVEYYINGPAFLSWNGTADNNSVEMHLQMRATIGASVLWERIVLYTRTAAVNTSLYLQSQIYVHHVEKDKAIGTYTIQYQGRYSRITPSGTVFGRIYTPSVGVIIHKKGS